MKLRARPLRLLTGVALGSVLVTFLVPARGAEYAKTLTLWTFDYGLTSSLGGEYNAYARSPSWLRTYLDSQVRHSSQGHALRVTAHRASEGFCGVWFEFFPKSLVPPHYFDSTPYRTLSFWVKGERGGEDFEIALADTELREERAPKRPLRAYLAGGASTGWQEVDIPLGDFAGLNHRRLTEMIIQVSTLGDERFYLDDVAFTSEMPQPASASQKPPAVAREPAAVDIPAAPRAVWVWNTQNLLDPAARAAWTSRFVKFAKAQGIRRVYLSADLDSLGTPSAPRYGLKPAERYREFLQSAHAEGLEVEALAGNPEWAAREFHGQALAAFDAVLAFNRAGPASARFDGLHFDVEPYLLVGYSTPAGRKELLTEYLEMVAKVAEKVKAEANFRFGCDVPFWFYPVGGAERAELTVSFRGEDKPVGEHVTDVVDTVTLMDYRNEADGAGGIVAAGLPALIYAAARSKNILVGLETSREPDRTVYFVCGLPLAEFQTRLAESSLRNHFYFDNFRLATYSDGSNVHVGLRAPEGLEGAGQAAFEKSLAALAKDFGASSDPARFNVQNILEQARAALASDAEWRGFEPFELTDPESRRSIAGFKTTYVMLAKETFYGLGLPTFDEETRSVVEWFGRYPSFAGLAIHHYDSFRDLTEGK